MHNKPVRPGRCHVAHRCRIYEIFPAYRPFGPEYFFPDNKILFSRPRISRYGGRIQQKAVAFLQLLLNMPFRVVGAEGVEPPTLCL